jgi:hypothetical protein
VREGKPRRCDERSWRSPAWGCRDIGIHGKDATDAALDVRPRDQNGTATPQALQAQVCADPQNAPANAPAGMGFFQLHFVAEVDRKRLAVIRTDAL